MSFVGMDVDQATTYGNQLSTQGDQLHTIVKALDRLLSQLESAWHGQDAAAFHSNWIVQVRPGLLAAAGAVSGLGQSVLNNVSEQTQASSPDVGITGDIVGPNGRPTPSDIVTETLKPNPFPILDLP